MWAARRERATGDTRGKRWSTFDQGHDRGATGQGVAYRAGGALGDARLGKGTFQELTRPAGENWRIILPMAWYEVDVLEAALEQVSGKLRVSAEDITTEVARANAEADLTSIYRVFLRVAQPQRGTHRAIRIVLR
jgi:hypothetical protein